MYCYECGTELVDGICPNCTTKRAGVSYGSVHDAKSAEVFSIIALVSGILSIAGYGLIYGIISLIFANLYKNRMGEYNDMAKIGRTLGLVGIIINAVAVALIITLYVVYAVVLVGLGTSGALG